MGFNHFRHDKRPLYSENIYWGASNDSQLYIDCKLAVRKWYNEIYNYNWQDRTNHTGTVAHFMQLIWKDTKRIGCAQARNIDGPKGGTYTVCAYYPWGNSRNPKIQFNNVLPIIITLPTISTTTTSPATIKAHYEAGFDYETELEREFKDVDDVIDSKVEYKIATESPSLEKLLEREVAVKN